MKTTKNRTGIPQTNKPNSCFRFVEHNKHDRNTQILAFHRTNILNVFFLFITIFNVFTLAALWLIPSARTANSFGICFSICFYFDLLAYYSPHNTDFQLGLVIIYTPYCFQIADFVIKIFIYFCCRGIGTEQWVFKWKNM